MKTSPFLLLLMAGAISSFAQTYSLSGEFSSMGTSNLSLKTNGTARLTVLNSNGFIGIGTVAPSESLDIFGTARFRTIPGNNGLTKLLVSDANGKIHTRDVSSLTASISNIPFTISATTSIGVGTNALINNTGNSVYDQGQHNTALGYSAMYSSTSSSGNTSVGEKSQYNNVSAYFNTAVGYYALYSNTSSNMNVAVGMYSLYATTGAANTAVGTYCLKSNSTGGYNNGIGYYCLSDNTTGQYNNAMGSSALSNNTTGSSNVAIGHSAGQWNETGSQNTSVGANAGSAYNQYALNNTTAIGYGATVSASNTIRLGNSSVTSIGGQVSWSTLSDGRFKTDIRDDVSGLEFIKQLKPVSYAFDQNSIDNFLNIPDSIRINTAMGRRMSPRQTGFIAQEVEEVVKRTGYVFHGVEAPQNDKDHYSIRYAEFVVPLVKAVQELNAKVEAQEKIIESLRREKKSASDESASEEVILRQNTPNPSASGTEISMNIPKIIRNATLVIYDLSGKQLEKRVITGRGEVVTRIEGGKFEAGIYLYSLIADQSATEAKRMVLTK